MSKRLNQIIEGVVSAGQNPGKKSTTTPSNDALPKEGAIATTASKAPKMQGKPGGPPLQSTTVRPTGGVTSDDMKKVSKQTKKAKEPAPNVAGGDRNQPIQGSSKVATPDNKKLGEEEELVYEAHDEDEDEEENGKNPFAKFAKFAKKGKKGKKGKKADDDDDDDDDDDEDEDEDEVEEEIQLPETKAGQAKLVFDLLRSMDKDELEEKYVDILNAILNENEEEDEVDEDSAEMVHEARARITSEDIDVTEDVVAMLSDENLSDDFKVKAATIFEAAVVAKINEEIDRLEQDFITEISEARSQFEQDLTNKVDGYLNYVVEEWMTENELAVERGIRAEITEDFITGLKDLFNQHYIEIPDERVDVVDELANRVSELETSLNESIETNIDLHQTLNGHEREEILYSHANGLADTEFEKLKGLADGVEFEDTDQYTQAISTLKESYFPRAPRQVEEEGTDELLSESLETKSSAMDAYSRAIGRTIRR